MKKIAINGFGRIGRMIARIGFDKFDLVAINDLCDVKTLAYLFEFDSAHGKFNGEVSYEGNSLIVNGKKIPVYAEKDPANLPWGKLNVDVVMECTGRFKKKEEAGLHIKAGAKKVIISAPSKDSEFVVVKGVNEHDYNGEEIISNGSCTTNSLAPIVKVLDDNFGIEKGFMTTIHSYTGDQRLQDFPHSDLRRGRAACQNLVPTTSGAAIAVTQVIPHLKGKLDGLAVRTPTIVGSLTDFVCLIKKETTESEINELMKNVSNNELKGVVEYSDKPIVSTDIIGNTHSGIFDSQLTKVIDGNFVKVFIWYDNEWGYSSRMVDLLDII